MNRIFKRGKPGTGQYETLTEDQVRDALAPRYPLVSAAVLWLQQGRPLEAGGLTYWTEPEWTAEMEQADTEHRLAFAD